MGKIFLSPVFWNGSWEGPNPLPYSLLTWVAILDNPSHPLWQLWQGREGPLATDCYRHIALRSEVLTTPPLAGWMAVIRVRRGGILTVHVMPFMLFWLTVHLKTIVPLLYDYMACHCIIAQQPLCKVLVHGFGLDLIWFCHPNIGAF